LGEPRIDILEGESVTLSGIVSGTNSYVWTPTTNMTGSTTLTPVVNPLNDVTYTLTATTTDGCVAKDEVLIVVLNELIIPNIFSPNGDGINDRFEIENIEKYKDATVDIFNRYGQRLMRYVGGYNTPWDGRVNGKDVPVGTYFYVIIPNAGKRKVISGSISIVR
jgi:gliding motility-associated-like protein